jgi:endonuclease YncB( thermonuclease family)
MPLRGLPATWDRPAGASLLPTLTLARIGIGLGISLAFALFVLFAVIRGATPTRSDTYATLYRIDHVADGDTVDLRNGARVRLVQIDTPEVYFGTECYGPQASAITKRLLPPGTAVRLLVEPATDRVDRYGRLLRYVIRARDDLDVNLELVTIGAAAPYFYDGRRGMYASRLEQLARQARSERLGLWGACPRTRLDPYRGVATRR